MNKSLSALLLGSAITLAGCANTQDNPMFSKENMGTVLGAGAGALLGSQVGGGSGRKVAILTGAIAGGFIGKTLGAQLDERDRQALAAQSEAVLRSGQDGQPVQWQSAHSGATATITPVASESRTQSADLHRTPKVERVANLSMINAPYQTTKGANIRSAPSTDGAKLGSLAAGSTFTALGRTDNNWIAVGRKGVNVGYIHAPLTAPVMAQKADAATDLDTLVVNKQNSEHAGFDLDAMSIETDQITASTQCRTLQYEVTTKGSTETAQTKACQSTDGAWELI